MRVANRSRAVDPASGFRPRRSSQEPRFVQVYPDRVDEVTAEHGLDRTARSVLLELLFLVDWRTATATTTKSDLAEELGRSRNTVARVLDELEAAGLIRTDLAPGRDGTVEVLVYGYLVRNGRRDLLHRPPVTSGDTLTSGEPSTVPDPGALAPNSAGPRAEQREPRAEQRERPARTPALDVETPLDLPLDVDDVVDELVVELEEAGFGVDERHRSRLRAKLERPVAAGWQAPALVRHVLAGELDSARHPLAVVEARLAALPAPPRRPETTPSESIGPRLYDPRAAEAARAALRARRPS